MKNIRRMLIESAEIKVRLASDVNFLVAFQKTASRMISALKMGRKILIAGNGGSAADAQHFAAELAGKFIHQRRGLPVIALTTNSSIVTAIGNDFGYKFIFSRQVEGLGEPGDVFVGISTSGNSENIIEALLYAKRMGITTVGISGNAGGKMKDLCDLELTVPSSNTQYIQEAHISIIHNLCAVIDTAFKNHK